MGNVFDEAEPIGKKDMVLFFLIDVSGSMAGSKIGAVNTAMEEVIPELLDLQTQQADSNIKVAVMAFSDGTKWLTPEPQSISEIEWKTLSTETMTNLGLACEELATKMSRKAFLNTPSLSFAPAIILMSDGAPTDDYKKGLEKLKNNNWFKSGIKVALPIGEDADVDVLAEFTGSKESVMENARNGAALRKMIKFLAVTSTQIGSNSTPITENGQALKTKQKIVEDAIQNVQDSGEMSDDETLEW